MHLQLQIARQHLVRQALADHGAAALPQQRQILHPLYLLKLCAALPP
jgi:hypothetical protein